MDRRNFFALAAAAMAAPPASGAAPPERGRFIEEMTWPEVAAAIGGGATTALLPTGGSEQNGPHMAIGKHNRIVRSCAGEIARRHGAALVAPVIAYVPEGGFDPPTENMAYPGTLGLSEPVFGALLREGARSLKLAGFRLVCFLGDHGLSQRMQGEVARTLDRAWRREGVRVATLDRYYGGNGQADYLRAQGFSPAEIGAHAGLLDTAELMGVAPDEVRTGLLAPKSWPRNSGAAGDPSRATPALGRVLLELKIAAGLAQLKEIEAAAARR
ncbi:MAG TPA: creatininase family protein [Stellaceae bacterium]|nr:creatininase family protein [Stellaceae bacterium]